MKTLKRLVSVLLVFSMIASMFLTVSAVENTAKATERTGITVEREQSANVFGEAVTHTSGYYVSDKKLEALPVTYEAWVYIPSEVYDTAGGVILGTQWDGWDDTWNGEGSADVHFSFGIKPGGHPTLVYGTNGSKQVWEATKGGVIPADKWTHVVIEHDTRESNKHVWCFIDAGGEGGWTTFEKVGVGAGLLTLDSTALNNPIFLAGDSFRGNSHALSSGIILGDVAVYSDLRSASGGEVKYDYENGADLSDPNLLLYYQISSANQNKDIKDASGHGYDMNYYRTFLTEEEMNEIRAQDEYEYAYSIAFLPDLQYMTNRFPARIGTIFDYIIENQEEKNIQYVVGLGDMTDADADWEWNVVKQQYALLDAAGIPYTVLRGNHDIYTTTKVPFDEVFGKGTAYYNHVAENGGFYDANSATNAYVRFDAGSVKYLILCLDWGIKDTKVLDWADQVIADNPDRRVIVTMHAWLNSDGTPLGSGDWGVPSGYSSGNINPLTMWNNYFAKHDNIDMIVTGHMHSDNILVTPVQGTNGNTVYQILIDSQASDLSVANGGYNGLGLVALMHFTADGNHSKVEYYSTTYNKYYYEKNTEISLDFGESNKFVESDGTPLVPNSSDNANWTTENGKLSLNNNGNHSLLRYENELDYNRVEVTMSTTTSTYKKSLGSTIREGLIFNVSDDGKEYYWVFVTQYNSVEVFRMPDWFLLTTPENNCGSTGVVNLESLSFDLDLNEFTLAAEWDGAGNIKILINDNVVYTLKDSKTPLTGDGFGLRAVKVKATDTTGTYFTSYLAGEKITSDTPDTPDIPDTPVVPETPVYENFKDADGNVLNPYFVNDVIWDNNGGKIFLPEKPAKGFLLFDNELGNNRIEATIVVKDNMGSASGYDGNKRVGLVFALTDHDGDGMFNSDGSDVSYYWAFINNWGCLEVIEMGKYGNWQWLSTTAPDINSLGINTDAGVTLAAEWNDEGHIKIFVNGVLAHNIVDPTPLTGDLYGLYATKHYNYASNPSLVNSYYTSFVAGTETPVKKVEVTVDPTEGTVTGAGEYYLGDSATLTATASDGYYFVGWYLGDTLVLSDATVTFPVTEDINVTAKFASAAHSVTVTAGANGTAIGSGTYGDGANVTVTATPNVGYKFVGWYNGETLVSSDAAYTFTLTENVTLTAKFDKLTYSIAVDGQGNLLNPYFVNGNVWTEANGVMKPAEGLMENFILFDSALATNRVEVTFNNLTLNNDGDTRNGIAFALTDIQGDHVFDMANMEKDGDVSYYFACISGWGEIQLIKMGGTKSWSVYISGGIVDASNGIKLGVEWDAQGNVKVFANGKLVIDQNVGEALTGNLYGVLMRSYANTEAGGYSLAYGVNSIVAGGESTAVVVNVGTVVDPTDEGTVTGAGEYYLGQSVTLTATPNAGFNFVGWFNGETKVSSDATYTFKAEADCTLTAKFTSITYTVTVTSGANGTATGSGIYGENASATVVATADTGYKFVGWYADDAKVSSDATYTFTVTADCALTAKFEKVEYTIPVDGNGDSLTPHFVDGVIWNENNGQLFLPGDKQVGFLLFDDELNANRIEATIVIKDNKNGGAGYDGNQRKGIVFALTDYDGDNSFTNGADVSYYWVFVGDWGNLCLVKMGKYQGWTWLHKDVALSSMGIDVTEGVTIAAEWDDQGNIKVYANGELAIAVQDTTDPLTGDLYGLYAVKHKNFATDPSLSNAYYTSFVAGVKSSSEEPTNVTVNVTTTEGGTVEGADEYELGATVTLTATADEGYTFEGWYENGELISADATITFTAEANRDLTAEFAAEVAETVFGDANGDGEVGMDDVVCIRKYIAAFDYNTNTSSESVEAGADFNGDGVVNMKDVILLRQYIVNRDYE